MEDMLDDPAAAVAHVYKQFDLPPMTEVYKSKLRDWKRANSRTPFDYSSATLPFEPAAILAAFKSYIQAHPRVQPGVEFVGDTAVCRGGIPF